MRTLVVECLLRQILVAFDTLSTLVSGLGGSGVTYITGPVVSTFNDPRGSVGARSYNPSYNGFPTIFEKVDNSPDTWVAYTVYTEEP